MNFYIFEHRFPNFGCVALPQARWAHRPGLCIGPEAARGASDRWQQETATARLRLGDELVIEW